MHPIFFGLKRAHHSALRIVRPMLAKMGLTAARFDLLFALKERRRSVHQSALRRILGVSRATVSRMLGSLEELGLVRRRHAEGDRRRKLVELTTRGRWRIAFAHRHLTRSGWAQLAVDSALGSDKQPYEGCHWYDSDSCLEAMETLDGLLDALRRGWYDRATLDYPWRPDDTYVEDPFDLVYEREQDGR